MALRVVSAAAAVVVVVVNSAPLCRPPARPTNAHPHAKARTRTRTRPPLSTLHSRKSGREKQQVCRVHRASSCATSGVLRLYFPLPLARRRRRRQITRQAAGEESSLAGLLEAPARRLALPPAADCTRGGRLWCSRPASQPLAGRRTRSHTMQRSGRAESPAGQQTNLPKAVTPPAEPAERAAA